MELIPVHEYERFGRERLEFCIRMALQEMELLRRKKIREGSSYLLVINHLIESPSTATNDDDPD